MKPQSSTVFDVELRSYDGKTRDTLCSPTKCTKYLTAEITENAEILKIK